jgi:hypothetical protein
MMRPMSPIGGPTVAKQRPHSTHGDLRRHKGPLLSLLPPDSGTTPPTVSIIDLNTTHTFRYVVKLLKKCDDF